MAASQPQIPLALEPIRQGPTLPPEEATEILRCIADLLIQVLESEDQEEVRDEAEHGP